MRNVCITAAAFTALLSSSSLGAQGVTHTFAEPLDALSVQLSETTEVAQVQFFADGQWSDWQDLAVDNEQDPTLLESNMVMLPEGVSTIRIQGDIAASEIHPIRISDAPVHYDVAATGSVGKPRILSRSAWGADESLLVRDTPVPIAQNTERDSAENNGNATLSKREQDCLAAQTDYPNEFKTSNKTTKTPDGKTLLWPYEYSPSVKLLVIHHTAAKTEGDARSGEERMRALYQYHAQNRGWGDIGYHYLVDDAGQIFEGKAGGAGVVGGHAYCNNVGSIGIALMGNFELEQPTQAQMKSLQWLLAWLGETYDVPLSGTVRFHGKSMPSIVGHRDVVSTACPGEYVYDALPQLRKNAASGQVDKAITFPKSRSSSYTDKTAQRRAQRGGSASSSAVQPRNFPKEGVSPLGATSLSGRPGTQLLFSMRYQAGEAHAARGAKIAEVFRSAPGIGLWQEKGGVFTRVATSIELPTLVPGNGTTQLRFKVQLPSEAGSYQMNIGPWTYQLEVSGRRSRGTPSESQFQRSENTSSSSRRMITRSSSSTSSVRSAIRSTSRSSRSSSSSRSRVTSNTSPNIRIRLTQQGALHLDMPGGTLNGSQTVSTSFSVVKKDETCAAWNEGREMLSGIVRFAASNDIITIRDDKGSRRVRGIVECRVVDGVLMLINELPLEDYLWGLAEEPDTEPYEKQRAFAITARTYAAYYMDSTHRKFPGKPYDGSDSPAEFQAYKGLDFESTHTKWVQAVKETAGLTLTKDGQLIRPPYFSSDDGRTRSPAEAGWKNFPFAEIFASKPDPWCSGMEMRGHGVGMSGCGSEGMANEGKTAEEILRYYYPGTSLTLLR